MRHAIRRHIRDFAAILGLIVIAAGVGGYILAHERFYPPSWVPFVGSDFYTVKAQFQTAQSVAPGQGQTVNIAGVKVGEISNVDLVDGRAVVTMKIFKKYSPIYNNATMLLRPKTGLNDMLIQLDPGTPSAGPVKDGQTLPIQRTKPNVNVDQILAALDGDTRDYLKLLLSGSGKGLKNQGVPLSDTLRRFEPTSRDLLQVTQQLAERRDSLRRVVHNLQLLSTELGSRGGQIRRFVTSSNQVFAVLARQERNIRASISELPDTLKETNKTLQKVDTLAGNLKPTIQDLRPGARSLDSSLRASQEFLKASTPIVRDKIRPFARAAIPTAQLLTPTAKNLAKAAPDVNKTLTILNFTLNALTYNPAGSADEGYLFWLAWANHTASSAFSFTDAHGPLRRGLLLTNCDALGVLKQIRAQSQVLDLIIQMVNLPTQAEVCK